MKTTIYEYQGIKFNQYALDNFPYQQGEEQRFSWIYIAMVEVSRDIQEIVYHNNLTFYRFAFFKLHSQCKFTLKWLPKLYPNESGIYIGSMGSAFNLLGIEDDKWHRENLALNYSKWYGNSTTIVAVPQLNKRHPEYEKSIGLYGFFERDSIFCPGTTEKVTWSGNYGVIIEELGKDHYLLHFSCGEFDFKDVTFQDLELELTIEGDYTPCFRCSDFSLWKKYRDQDVAEYEAKMANKNS